MKNRVFATLFALVTLSACLAACGGTDTTTTTQLPPTPTPSPTPAPHIDGWLNVRPDGSVRYLSWTSSGGVITGFFAAAILDQGKPSITNGILSGSQNGNQVTLIQHIGLETATATGTINGTTLTLQTPQPDGSVATAVYQGVTKDKYDQALAAFKAAHPGPVATP